MDITNIEHVNKLKNITDVQILINNAGSLSCSSIIDGDMDMLISDMNVNYYGTINVTRALAPIIAANGGGAITTISSILALASVAGIAGYCASKAALFSAIQSMRSELKSKNINVYGIFPGAVDNENSNSDASQTSSLVMAENIFEAMLADQEYVFPDPMSESLGEIWSQDPKGLEAKFSSI